VGSVCAPVIELSANTPASVSIKGRIACIENADPGFDWIFTKAPAGLITCFGGANSHMAIRSAELGLPAAIGCGDQIYERVVRSGRVELNCAGRILRPVHGN
jgi:phosphoenolpyruvate synthase/pyruvate phosphate dikinase